ncbi:NAD(P)/FAD-dependent oxidoreductase [Kibdelosporangium philippinense]|uniref:NAD(P)/FAD-dependent oxidoreductase n=1 Tax=Kibdelosporangium philippinense TaxID=211113 RepID=A0ABS8Z305_9PSEU|nr:NAD(P)/FAD-dependent oxidoreductase [Kibdelosporangium philippinense]MCE7002316.1 NAD(P)/FAD-dependent oxidoreductase [Kibdelosporangium philippinense]
MYDAIVVGARCAGASTALLLARAGHRVLVLDRGRPGTDKLSTLYIHQPGVARLAKWDVLDAIKKSGCQPLDRPTYQVADIHLTGPAPEADGNRAAYGPRRFVLDPILADAAAESGADVRFGATALGLLTEGERVTGLRYRDSDGVVRSENTPLVIGADGMRSSIAKLVGAQEYAVHQKLTCAYYSYWSGVPAGFEQYQRPGHWVGVIPTNDDRILVAAYFLQREFDRIKGAAQEHYLDNIRQTTPTLFERLQAGEQVERMYGTGDQLNFLRTAAGPGWALVGDSGHHKDSLTARGITDAFLQAELLAECVGPKEGGPSTDDALKRYLTTRDSILLSNYKSTLSVARLEVTEERLRMLRVIQESPELTERYFAAAAGIIAPEDFYTEELLPLAS